MLVVLLRLPYLIVVTELKENKKQPKENSKEWILGKGGWANGRALSKLLLLASFYICLLFALFVCNVIHCKILF
jgi:hypothetical protein